MAQSDTDLMKRVQRREPAAFELLAQRHEDTLRLHLRRYVGPHDAEDLLQEVRLRLWERAGQWQGRGAPLAWLLRVATNLALNHIRARRSRAESDLSEDEDTALGDPALLDPRSASISERAERRERAAHLMDLISEMPEDKQMVLRRARLESEKLQDIADDLGLPLGTVKSRLHFATRWLAQRWEEEE